MKLIRALALCVIKEEDRIHFRPLTLLLRVFNFISMCREECSSEESEGEDSAHEDDRVQDEIHEEDGCDEEGTCVLEARL